MKQSQTISFFVFVCLTVVSCGLQAQLKADFVADTLSFCPPHSVGFTDLSTGGSITSRRWDFGQGGSSNTNNTNPSASYINSGSYTVKLVVSNGSSIDSITKTAYIKVFKLPGVNMTTKENRTGCAPLSLNFVDSIKLGDAPIKSYSWNFGDGYRSTLQAPFHKYTADGNYTVVFSVTDTNGCSNSIKKKAFVNVIASPKVNFLVTPAPSSCKTPHKVTFVNNSTGKAPLTYLWKFGNGATSTARNPTYSFGVGAYDITLVVTNGTGCVDSLKKTHFITVGAPKADFDVIDTFCLSDTNQIFFKNKSIGANTFKWEFGDGVISSFRNPTHRYFQKGKIKVRLIIGLGTACSDTIDKYIQVIQPVASYTTDIGYWCDNKKVLYTPGGTYVKEAKTAIWDLWGWPLKQQYGSPPVKFAPKTFFKKKKGKHSDTLTVFYPKWGSCSAKVALQKFEIWRPSGNPLIAPYTGCAPITVQLEDRMYPRDSVTVGTWLFDSLNPRVTRKTSKTYTLPGTYKISYTFKHKRLGCVYKYGPFDIEVGKKQKANFFAKPITICKNDTVKFINTSSDTTKIKKYSWSYDWAKRLPFEHDKNGQYSYKDTGYKSVMLIVDNNGCPDTLIIDSAVHVVGPYAQVAVTFNCDTPNLRRFTPIGWNNVTRWKYDFGDTLGYDSINQTTSYTYAKTGEYDSKLILYDDSTGCEMEIENKIYITAFKFVSSINKTVGCFPSFFEIETDSSTDLESGILVSYGVVKNLGPAVKPKFLFKTKIKGRYKILVIGSDKNGCEDTNSYWIKTYNPTPNFWTSLDSGCAPLAVQLRDSSTGDTTLVHSSWWVSEHGVLYQKNPSLTFGINGRKKIILSVRDTLGCTALLKKYIEVFRPKPSVVVDTQVCTGVVVNFENKRGLPGETHAWEFGDSLTGTGRIGKVIYNKPGKKSIKLTTTDIHGCDSVIDKKLWIDVQKPVLPNVVSLPKDTTCYPADIDFSILNRDSSVKFYFWRFDSADAFVRLSGPTAFYNYDRPGNYGVDIGVETTYGCRDTFRIDSLLNIDGPYARFDMPDTFCLSDESTFTLRDVEDVYEFRMDFGDGILDTFPSSTRKISHQYANSGFFPVSLIFTDSLGACVKSWQDSLYVQEILAKINYTDTVGCAEFILSVNADSVKVHKYEWSIGKNVLGIRRNYSNGFSKPGNYTIVLKPINNNTGCYGIDSLPFTVFPLPDLTKSKDGLYCYEDSISAQVKGAKVYLWTPNTYLSSDTMGRVKLKPEKDISYHVVGTSEFGCMSSIDLKYKVVKPPYIDAMEDTTLFLGQVMQMDQKIEGSWNYLWTPALFLSCRHCPNPEIKANRDITYTLTISDDSGCFEVDTSFSVYVKDEYKLLIPNAFTPNNDGLNDIYSFYSEGFKRMDYFRIFNRWGEQVYEFSDMQDGWDGLYNGDYWPTNAALVYSGRFIRYNNEAIDVSGSVILIR